MTDDEFWDAAVLAALHHERSLMAVACADDALSARRKPDGPPPQRRL